MPLKKLRALVLFFVGSYSCVGWGAGFGINTTRIIYHEQDPSVQITMRNTTMDTTYLVRATVVDDLGQGAKDFVVLPPLFRLDARHEGSVRVVYQPLTPLPKDRESVFYFKALAIPNTNPLTREGRVMSGQVKLAVGNQIKFFYRPNGIPDPAKNAFQALEFSRIPAGIKVKNPTPYNVTFATLLVDGKPVSMENTKTMIPPFSSDTYLSSSRIKKMVTWGVINDLGGVDTYSGTVR